MDPRSVFLLKIHARVPKFLPDPTGGQDGNGWVAGMDGQTAWTNKWVNRVNTQAASDHKTADRCSYSFDDFIQMPPEKFKTRKPWSKT